MPTPLIRWLPIAIALLLAIVVFVPIPHDTRGLMELHDFAHAPLFGLVALLSLLGLRARDIPASTFHQYLAAFVLTSLLGGAVELIQIPVGRDASWLDVRSDVLGAAALLGIFAVFDPRVTEVRVRVLAGSFAVLSMGVHSIPLAQSGVAYRAREQSFPTLFDVTQGYDDYFLQYHEAEGEPGAMPEAFAQQPAEQALHVFFEPRWSPFIHLLEPEPDWRGYRRLALDLTNASQQPLTINLGVRDLGYDERKRDGFRRAIVLPPLQRVTVQLALDEVEHGNGRLLDMSAIGGVVLFDEFATAPHDFYISRIWLE